MPPARFLITLLLLSTFLLLSKTATSSPYISPNPIYSDAGILCPTQERSSSIPLLTTTT